jgi:hypothetical protein
MANRTDVPLELFDNRLRLTLQRYFTRRPLFFYVGPRSCVFLGVGRGGRGRGRSHEGEAAGQGKKAPSALVPQANRAKIPVMYMAGSADRMRIHQTALWRVRHKRPFSVRSTRIIEDPAKTF